MSTTTVLTTEKPRQWLARRRDDVEKMLGGGKRDDDYVPERLKHAARPATKPDRMIQLVFALGLLVPLVAFTCVDPAGAVDAYALQYATIKQLPRYIMTGPFVAAVLCLCVERACYTLVWCCPRAFGEFCSKHNLGAPVDVIVRLFGVNKFFQLLGFAHLYLIDGATGAVARAITSGRWCVDRVQGVDEGEDPSDPGWVYFVAHVLVLPFSSLLLRLPSSGCAYACCRARRGRRFWRAGPTLPRRRQ